MQAIYAPIGHSGAISLNLNPQQGQKVQTVLELTNPLCSAVSLHTASQTCSKCSEVLLNSKSCNAHTRLGKPPVKERLSFLMEAVHSNWYAVRYMLVI